MPLGCATTAWLSQLLEVSHSGHRALRSMEGLRGFAVFLVFLVHYVTLTAPWVDAASRTSVAGAVLRNVGNSGVDLFFVLSGYLIYGNLIRKGRPFLAYARRRIQRIYPTFLAVFVLYLLLSFVFSGQSKLPHGTIAASGYVLANLLLLPGLLPIEPLITVAWSLSYEVFYYLSAPLL
ncbi:MAG: acyltransferase, partial [Acidobacteriota bacterium]